ncbi:zinc transport [Fusarium beomiforme]|uniref:Zinc transport n=1 Tax=Fusarium beomiforme TaxID=44412 RepID=A0A9P5AHV2_9HYPO|nr:zinc transport [Fusarium beomiforme]
MAKPKSVHHVLDGRYYDEIKLQRVLEKLFPGQNGKFGLRMSNDQWVFKAPRQVSLTELESICQRHSWKPLQITEQMLKFLVDKFHLKSSIWDISSCFYAKNFDIESTFCVPFTVSQDGPIIEVSYTIRYPEFKAKKGDWIIRQTGIYQVFNIDTNQNLCILFNPTPLSKLHQVMQDYVSKKSKDAEKDFFCLHKELFNAHFSSWRLYNAYLERILIPIANHAVATWIEELTEAEYRHLTEIAYLEGRLVQIPAILACSNDVLEGLSSLCRDWYPYSTAYAKESARTALIQFQQHQRNCQAYTRVADFLQQRAQKITQLLANTLSFREQLHAKVQNNSMLQLNKSAVFITTLTLLYLPASFVATFFGMNFFDLDDNGDQITMTSMIWIYFLSSAALTIGTFLLYHILLDKTLLSRVARSFPVFKAIMHGRDTKSSSDIESCSM